MEGKLPAVPAPSFGAILQCPGEDKGIKDFINVLMLYREHKAEEIEAAAELA